MSWYGDALQGWYRSKIASADAMEAGISQFGSAIGKAIEETRQNSIANQIGTQNDMGPVTAAANSGAYAPRAALVSPGENPDTGASNYIPGNVPTAGTAPAHAPFTGGYRGLQLQTAIDSLRRQNANTQSEMALREAEGKYYGAHTNVIQQNADTMAARERDYNQRVNQKGADTIQKINSELGIYGKAAAPQILGALAQDPTGAAHRGDIKTIDGQQVWVPNPNGSIFSPNAPAPNPADNGIFGIGAHGAQPKSIDEKTIQIPWSEAQKYQKRYNDISNAASGGGGGNLPQVTNAQDYAQVPSGSQYMDPQGNIRTKP